MIECAYRVRTLQLSVYVGQSQNMVVGVYIHLHKISVLVCFLRTNLLER